MLHHCHRYRKGVIRWSHCQPCHWRHRARSFPTRDVKHWSYTARTVRPCFCLSSGVNDPNVGVRLRVIVWLLAIWIGGFFHGVGIATPKGNNLLVYTLILLVRAACHVFILTGHLPPIPYRSLVSLSVCLVSQQRQWPSAPHSLLGDRPSCRN